MKFNKYVLLIAASLPMSVLAQDITTKNVVVTANNISQELMDVQSTINVVQGEDIVKDGAISVADGLKDVPGVAIHSDGTPGVKTISIRSENTNKSLIMVDGIRVDDQKTKSGVPFLVNPFFVDRVEIVKGPASVLYGSDAVGGTVNIITKKSYDEPFSIEAGTVYNGAYNGMSEYANVGGTYNKFKYMFGAFYSDQGNLYIADRQRVDNTGSRTKGFNANLAYDVNDKLTIGLSQEYFDINAKTSTTVQGTDYDNFRANIPMWKRQKTSIFADWHNINDYIAAIKANVYYQINDKDFNSANTYNTSLSYNAPVIGAISIPGTVTPDVLTENRQDAYGVNLQSEFSLNDSNYLITGYDFRRLTLDSYSNTKVNINGKISIPAIGDKYMSINTLQDDYINNIRQDSNALYGLLTTNITDSLVLNTGVRWNNIKTGHGNQNTNSTTTVTPPVGSAQVIPGSYSADIGNKTYSKTIFSAGLVWNAFEQGAFRINWAQGFRAPTIQELFLTTNTGEEQVGNPNLKPETSNNYELGFRLDDFYGVTSDIAAFYSIAKNYIETSDITAPNAPRKRYSFQNIGSSKAFGVEWSVSYNIDNFTPYLDLTWMKRQYESNGKKSYNTGTPALDGRAGLRYDNSYEAVNYYVDTYVRFATTRDNDNLDGTSYFGNTHMGGYTTYNLSLGTNFGENNQYKIFASLENIFDKRYQTTELIHEPGRFVVVGASAKF